MCRRLQFSSFSWLAEEESRRRLRAGWCQRIETVFKEPLNEKQNSATCAGWKIGILTISKKQTKQKTTTNHKIMSARAVNETPLFLARPGEKFPRNRNSEKAVPFSRLRHSKWFVRWPKSVTAISISPRQFQLRSRQFQLRSRQFQFHHGNFNFTTAISTSSRQFQFHHGNFNFVHGNFNFIMAISISPRQFQLHHGNFNFVHGNFNFIHGNFNFVTAISTLSRQFQFHLLSPHFPFPLPRSQGLSGHLR